jgi:hypothetical protein
MFRLGLILVASIKGSERSLGKENSRGGLANLLSGWLARSASPRLIVGEAPPQFRVASSVPRLLPIAAELSCCDYG